MMSCDPTQFRTSVSKHQVCRECDDQVVQRRGERPVETVFVSHVDGKRLDQEPIRKILTDRSSKRIRGLRNKARNLRLVHTTKLWISSLAKRTCNQPGRKMKLSDQLSDDREP